MYVPKLFQVTDTEEVVAFIKEHGFGTVVTVHEGKPIASHIPLEYKHIGDTAYICGHIAYGNPQWRTFATNEHVLVIFQGPHAYISSSWYSHENVPTWNYQVVHVYGTATIVDTETLIDDLTTLLAKYEHHRERPVLWDTLSPSLRDSELRGIVGFRIKVVEVQAAYKLSQNRNDADYRSIVTKLKEEGQADAEHMAKVMEKRRILQGPTSV